MRARKKKSAPKWPVEKYQDTCEHVALVGTVAPRSAIPIDIGFQSHDGKPEILIGLREFSEDSPWVRLSIHEVQRLASLLADAVEKAVGLP